MAYTLAPFNPSTPYQNQVATELNTANNNFTILGQAFYNNDPSSNPVLRASYVGSSAPSNPVAGMTWLDTSTTPPTLKVYDGSNWQRMASLNSSGVLDLSNSYVKSNIYTFRRVDLSNASSDYTLQAGEEAYISFSSATSVPLHIAMDNTCNIYEIYLETNGYVNNSTFTTLNPNNTTYSSSFSYISLYWNSQGGSGSSSGTNANAFGLCNQGLKTFTIVDVKNLITRSFVSYLYDNTNVGIVLSTYRWYSNTTSWTSLGTIVFPQSMSGYILVRRIA